MPVPRPGRLAPTLLAVATAVLVAPGARPQPPQPTPQPPGQPTQPTEIQLVIGGEPGAPPKYAVPDFLALSPDGEATKAAATIAEVLFKDLEFEREFYLIPRDTYRSVPPARSLDEVPFAEWRQLGADGLVVGSVERRPNGLTVRVKLYNVRTRQAVFAREYTGSAANPRLFAHTIADEIHLHQRGLRGVARTKIAFSSDRDGERIPGPVADRAIQEIYICDYDGANQRRITVNRSLNITPVWSPDGRAIAYTSYRRGFPDVYISFIYEGRLERPAGGTDRIHNYLPAWSPDGRQIAFTSNRDGNPEIYVMNADGTNLRRVTNHPAIDTTPTWSPTGQQLAFTSDRTGSPQIYIVGVDGVGLRRVTTESYCDRATWSSAYNEIAYTCRSGGAYDIKIYDVATGASRQITFGEGSNESPAFAPNGRHLVFTSTRRGRDRVQLFTIARDGRDVRQITFEGNNRFPHWSQ
jgi:TolB protein